MQHKGKDWEIKEIGRGRKTKVVKKVLMGHLSDPDYMGNYTGKVYIFRRSFAETNHIGICDCRNGLVHHDSRPALRYLNGALFWHKEGELHRIDGPAVERSDKSKEWWIDGYPYEGHNLKRMIKTSVYLGKEKGKYDFEWLKFLTDQGIEWFPVVSGMKEDVEFVGLFDQLIEVEKE
jgi:hypothetical protein